jgi:hypothetical protein
VEALGLHLCARMRRVSVALLGRTWRRRWIRRADGREDATTAVWWVQAGQYYGDLRIPAPGDSAARVEGFAGELTEADGVFEWRRDVDLRPTGRRDVGRLRFMDAEGNRMIEEGAEQAYTELWERTETGAAPLVMRLDRSEERGWFVGAGGSFVLAVDRGMRGVEVSYGEREGEDGVVVASSEARRVGERAFGRRDPREIGWALLIG